MRKLVAAAAALGLLGLVAVLALPLLLVSALSSSASSSCSGLPVDLPAPTGANVDDVWANLIAQGFSEVVAAGVMGNMQTETAGTFDPLIVQGGGRSLDPAAAGGGGFGLVQWSPGAKLIPLLHGALPSITSEVAALTEQLRPGGDEAAAGAALLLAITPEEAANVFGLRYERYAGPLQAVRASQARAIYDQYAGSTPGAVPGPPGTCTVPPGGPLPAGGGVGQDSSGIPCANGDPGRIELAPGSVPIRVCVVNGFTVNTLIVSNFSDLLAAAAANGIILGGGAFRSNASQIALRRAHCGPTEYDIYQRPSSQCSPPTAIPGQSLHEWGLAIDFTQGGGGLSRASSGYAWLVAHAAAFGLINLPSEPWHWSSSGK